MAMTFNNPFAPKVGNVDAKPTAGKGSTADDVEDFLNDESGEEVPKDKDDKPKDKLKEDKDKALDIEDDEDEAEDDDKDTKDKKDKEEDEDDEDKLEIEDKDDDEDDDKLELKKDKEEDLAKYPKKKEILAKYPKFFEEFPAVEKMIFRDRQYNEMFGSFDNAKEIYERSEQFNSFESQLLSGDTANILAKVKEADPKAYDKIVDNYLNVLEKNDADAFKDVVGNYMKRVIGGMVAEANKKNDKELFDHAKELHEYIFGTTEWEDPKLRTVAEESDEVKKLKEDKAAFVTKKFNEARNTLQKKTDNVLRSTINDHIDPREQMSPFEKKKAIEDVLERLHRKNDGDKTLGQNLNKLWKSAFADDFSDDSLTKIRKTYLGKSSTLLTGIIREVRNEVLKDKTPRAKKEEKETEEDTAPRQSKTHAGRPNQQTPKAKDRQKGESVEDFFGRD